MNNFQNVTEIIPKLRKQGNMSRKYWVSTGTLLSFLLLFK